MYKPNWKVEITRDDGKVDDVSDDIIYCSVTRSASDSIGTFHLRLNNKEGKYKGNWDGGERIDIWADFSNASNKIFRGKLERIFFILNDSGYSMDIAGSDGGRELLDATVIETYTNKDVAEIVEDIISKYATNVTYTKVMTGKTINSIPFKNKSAWNCIKEALERADHYFFINADLQLKHYKNKSRQNKREKIVHGLNMKSCNIGKDIREIKNKVIVYGGQATGSSDVVYLKTVSDSVSISNYGKKEMVTSVSELVGMDSIKEKAEYLLNESKDAEKRGNCTSLGLPTLEPGELVFISAQYANVGDYYTINSFTHTISAGEGFLTTVTVKKKQDLIRGKIDELYSKIEGVQTFINQFNLENSYVVDFDESPSLCTHTRTEEKLSALVLAEGATSGITEIQRLETESNVTKCELKIYAQDIGVSKIYVSNDDGVSWEEIAESNTLHTFSSVGKMLRMKIELASNTANPNPTVWGLGIMYK